MQSFGSFLVSLVAASSLAAAAPAASNGGTFAVPAQYNANARLSGPAALAKIYTKYGKSLPHDLSQALLFEQQKVTGSAGAHPQDNDQYYTTPVEFGTPAQTIYMDLDTGSSDLWVFSNDTYADQVNGQKLYLPGHSSTAKRLPKLTWDAEYGDGSTSSGIVYSDVVSIGGAKVQNQAVESARNVSEQFATDARMSGIVGLAFGNLNTVKPTKQKTFFDNIMPSLNEPLFTVNLKHKAGALTSIGFVRHSRGNMILTPRSQMVLTSLATLTLPITTDPLPTAPSTPPTDTGPGRAPVMPSAPSPSTRRPSSTLPTRVPL